MTERDGFVIHFLETFVKKLLGRTRAARPVKGRNFCADNRVIFRRRVYLKPTHIFFGNRHIGKNCFNRAFGQTGVAVNTGIGIDKKFVGQFVKRLDGANRRAIGVFAFNARFSHDICHL